MPSRAIFLFPCSTLIPMFYSYCYIQCLAPEGRLRREPNPSHHRPFPHRAAARACHRTTLVSHRMVAAVRSSPPIPPPPFPLTSSLGCSAPSLATMWLGWPSPSSVWYGGEDLGLVVGNAFVHARPGVSCTFDVWGQCPGALWLDLVVAAMDARW
jgi:hypothetical protein